MPNIHFYEGCLKKAKETGDRSEEAKACGCLGDAYYKLREFKTAISYYEQLLNLGEDVIDKSADFNFYNKLGNAYFSLGDSKEAINWYERCLTAIDKAKRECRQIKGCVYGNLGTCYYKLGLFKKAIFCFERSLEIVNKVGDILAGARLLGSIGCAYRNLGEVQKAIGYHERCLRLATERKDKTEESRAYGHLSIAYNCLGNFKKAVFYDECFLKIAQEMGDKSGESVTYCSLGNNYSKLGKFDKALDNHERHLKLAILFKDRSGEGVAYTNIGGDYHCLGEFKKAIDYQKRALEIAKELKDKRLEGKASSNLGSAFFRLGDYKKAIEFHENRLKIAKELDDASGEGIAYGSIGNAYFRLGNYPSAKAYYDLRLKSAQALRDRSGEGLAYGHLGHVWFVLEDFTKAIDYYERLLKISQEGEERAVEGKAYGNLAYAYFYSGDAIKSKYYEELHLKIAKEVEDMADVGDSYAHLGFIHESTDSLQEALECYQASVKACNTVRGRLQSEDDWKISLRELNQDKYTSLCRVLLKLDRSVEAFFAAEEGRAQALKDLLKSQYGIQTTDANLSGAEREKIDDRLCGIPSNTIFLAFQERVIITWVVQNNKNVHTREKKVEDMNNLDDVVDSVKKLIDSTFDVIGVRGGVRCEDRSLEGTRSPTPDLAQRSSFDTTSVSSQKHQLRRLYDVIINPIADLIHGDEIIIVPEGPLWLAPYAAFMDSNSRFLFESFKIRVIPSLTALKMIIDRPGDLVKPSALLVGDPWVQEVILPDGTRLWELPSAKEEVDMIGKILDVMPLTGKDASKYEVLKRLSTVQLVHIAAHGRMKTGEIALSPNPSRESKIPKDEDYLLTMKDVLDAKLQAKLVVLSCCHSGRGEIKAEGVVGIARAFIGAGARSVLVTLWAIDDEATLEFMKHFYQHLVKGKSASESLNRAMRCMRESEDFSEVKYWAPFVLTGDDVTLQFCGSS